MVTQRVQQSTVQGPIPPLHQLAPTLSNAKCRSARYHLRLDGHTSSQTPLCFQSAPRPDDETLRVAIPCPAAISSNWLSASGSTERGNGPGMLAAACHAHEVPTTILVSHLSVEGDFRADNFRDAIVLAQTMHLLVPRPASCDSRPPW